MFMSGFVDGGGAAVGGRAAPDVPGPVLVLVLVFGAAVLDCPVESIPVVPDDGSGEVAVLGGVNGVAVLGVVTGVASLGAVNGVAVVGVMNGVPALGAVNGVAVGGADGDVAVVESAAPGVVPVEKPFVVPAGGSAGATTDVGPANGCWPMALPGVTVVVVLPVPGTLEPSPGTLDPDPTGDPTADCATVAAFGSVLAGGADGSVVRDDQGGPGATDTVSAGVLETPTALPDVGVVPTSSAIGL
jgi:hypothetical protein